MILLVDDSASILAIYGNALEQAGYAVLRAANAHDAFQLLQQNHERVMVLATDLILPQQLRLAVGRHQRPTMHGLELVRRALRLCPDLKIILFSGQPNETIRTLGSLPRGTPFLRKPFSAEALVRTVREMFETECR